MWPKAELLPLTKSMTSRSVRFLLACLVALTFSLTNAFGQGSKMKSPYDPIEEGDQDRPDKRAEWNQRGRTAPPGQSACVNASIWPSAPSFLSPNRLKQRRPPSVYEPPVGLFKGLKGLPSKSTERKDPVG